LRQLNGDCIFAPSARIWGDLAFYLNLSRVMMHLMHHYNVVDLKLIITHAQR
jgi:hypothetical protein